MAILTASGNKKGSTVVKKAVIIFASVKMQYQVVPRTYNINVPVINDMICIDVLEFKKPTDTQIISGTYPSIKPPVGLVSTPIPPENPENTGNPKQPMAIYMQTVVKDNFNSSTAPIRYSASVQSDIGIGPKGIATGDMIHNSPLAIAPNTIDLDFI